MKRSINELLAYLFAVLFGGAACWALGTDRCVASIVAMCVMSALCTFFTGLTLFEIYDALKARKKR